MSDSMQPAGDKMKKVLSWVSEELQAHPEKTRKEIFLAAEVRFDLSPLECKFLNEHFARKGSGAAASCS